MTPDELNQLTDRIHQRNQTRASQASDAELLRKIKRLIFWHRFHTVANVLLLAIVAPRVVYNLFLFFSH